MYRQTYAGDSWQTNQIIHHLAKYMRLYGYILIDLPIIESAELFLVKAGDQLVDKLFTFERYGQQLALRPEFTAAAAYYYLTEAEQQRAVRWQFHGYIFEDDAQSTGQNHQRLSMGAEMIGIDNPVIDAEIMNVAAHGLDLIGIKSWQLVLGHIGLVRQMLQQFQLDTRVERLLLSYLPLLKTKGKAYVIEQVEKFFIGTDDTLIKESFTEWQSSIDANTQQMVDVVLDTNYRGTTMGGRTRQDIARRLGQKRKRFLSRPQISSAIELLMQVAQIQGSPPTVFPNIRYLIHSKDHTSFKTLQQWEETCDELMNIYNIPSNQILLQPSLARSWDYYSGVVFELRTAEDILVGGGGRYNGLIRLLGNEQDIPAVGFAYYLDSIMSVVPPVTDNAPPIYTILFDDLYAKAANKWAQTLRTHGIAAQLVPKMQNLQLDANQLIATQDGQLQWQSNNYRLEDIESLILQLQQSDAS